MGHENKDEVALGLKSSMCDRIILPSLQVSVKITEPLPKRYISMFTGGQLWCIWGNRSGTCDFFLLYFPWLLLTNFNFQFLAFLKVNSTKSKTLLRVGSLSPRSPKGWDKLWRRNWPSSLNTCQYQGPPPAFEAFLPGRFLNCCWSRQFYRKHNEDVNYDYESASSLLQITLIFTWKKS